MTVAIRLGAVAVDCADPGPLAEFYAAFAGWEIAFRNESFAAVGAGSTWLTMQRVADYRPPSWPSPDVPKQLHLDFAVDDLDEAQALALRLGATEPASQPDPQRWRVLLDPAGHPFCVTVMIPE